MNEQDILATLGANIKHYRSRSGWSQAELADKINLSIPFLSDVERGKTWISPATLLKFANVFNLEVYELLKPATRLSSGQSRLLDKYNEDAHSLLDKLHRKYAAGLRLK
jgi:transcriptional regulator with XRE-family HTH domain